MNIKEQIQQLLPADKYRLLRELNKLKNSSREKLKQKINHAQKLKEKRQANFPKPALNSSLPIYQKKQEIIDTIRKNRVCIITGETGSGKTTQIPQLCLLAGKGRNGKIACTQPRRIAALTVAERIREEIKTPNTVSHAIRFDDNDFPESYIKVLTDGILLAETQRDPFLNEYDTIIIDEAHERSLNIDFLLGILKNLLNKRKDLTIIITSATIDTKKFSKAFDDAPIISVSGRTFPVELIYLDTLDEELTSSEKAIQALELLTTEFDNGDVLIFMPTEQDIKETCSGLDSSSYDILPLYARLPASQQKKVFAKSDRKKIIVATNVAETSVTIPGIKYVIDTGLARISSYSAATKTNSLPIKRISKSSADQRKGRCGRIEDGICIRLYSQDDYAARELFTPPEILRNNLAEIILKMLSLKLNDVRKFPFIDPPKQKNINDGYNTLLELNAVRKEKDRYELTETGRKMARIPLDPRLSKIVLESAKRFCLNQALTIVSALSIQDPRERPEGKEKKADRIHREHQHEESDFFSLLQLWEQFQNCKQQMSMRKFCKSNFLSFKRMRDWVDIRRQIKNIVEENGIHSKNSKRDEEQLHKAILSGFLSNIAEKKEKKEKNFYTGSKNKEVMLFPGSALFNNGGQWIVAADMVKTSRLFARTAAIVKSEWIEECGAHLCKHSYSDIHWSKKQNQVKAKKKTSIFGLLLSADKFIDYSLVNSDAANDYFISEALVKGNFTPNKLTHGFKFLKHNLELKEHLVNMENKQRRRDILIPDYEIVQLYKKEIPDISNFQQLKDKIKKEGSDKFLYFNEKQLKTKENEVNSQDFPDNFEFSNTLLKIQYNFNPGEQKDGVTIKVPIQDSAAIDPELFEWLVPGMLKEKITCILKGLPKEIRKKLVPVNQTVDAVIPLLQFSKGSFFKQLSEVLRTKCMEMISPDILKAVELPDHLHARIALTDAKGKEISANRDTSVLLEQKSAELDKIFQKKKKYEQKNITSWPDIDFTKTTPIQQSEKLSADFYPGLEFESGQVSIHLYPSIEERDSKHSSGVINLLLLQIKDQLSVIRKSEPLPREVSAFIKTQMTTTEFHVGLFRSLSGTIINAKEIYTQKQFEEAKDELKGNIYGTYEELFPVLSAVMSEYISFGAQLKKNIFRYSDRKAVEKFLTCRLQQWRDFPGFKTWTLFTTVELKDLQRWLKGLQIRIERGLGDPAKDRKKEAELLSFYNKRDVIKKEHLKEFTTMLNELELSVFSPEVRQRVKVTVKKLKQFVQSTE